jgi:hypothetical protein
MTTRVRTTWLCLTLAMATFAVAASAAGQQYGQVFPGGVGPAGVPLPTNVQYVVSRTGQQAFLLTTLPYGGKVEGPVRPMATGQGLVRPLGFSPGNGLQISVELNWPGAFGYRPVKVTFRPQQPGSADREIRLRFHGGTWHNQGRSIEVDHAMVLRGGDASVSGEFLVPQYLDWHLYGWEVWVDGQLDDDLTVVVNNNQQGMTANLTVLATPPDSSNAQIQMALQGPSGSSVSLVSLAARDMPADWLAYSSLDLVVMPASQLPVMAESAPKQTEALLRWVRTGGNLWLVEAGSNWQRLETIEPVFAKYSGESAWRAVPVGERAVDPVEQALELSGFDTGERPLPALKDLPQRIGSYIAPVKASDRWFRVRALGLGVIAAFPGRIEPPPASEVADDGSLPADPSNAYSTLNALNTSLLGARFHGTTRQGNYPGMSNVEFNNWLIPNVGIAPVTQFQLLMTLFALAIGPANYWWLKRRKKLPLLLVTTPLAALAVTAALLAYGVFADGVGVRVRARSLTLLDQRSGDAASWARLSYYAGMAPRDGLAMPRDTALYPILPDWSDDYGWGQRSVYMQQRQMKWDEKQRLTRGWLASRTPTQYLAITSRPTKKRLELRAGEKGLRVINKLGVDVRQAVVRDHEGREYYFENLADGSGVIVPTARRQDFAAKMRKAFSDNFPEFPSGAESPNAMSGFGGGLSKNVMEARLEAINSPIVQHWGDGSYIAVTRAGVELDLGIDGVREEASFHVIEGRW